MSAKPTKPDPRLNARALELIAMANEGDVRAQASIASYISREPQNRTAFMQAVVRNAVKTIRH